VSGGVNRLAMTEASLCQVLDEIAIPLGQTTKCQWLGIKQ